MTLKVSDVLALLGQRCDGTYQLIISDNKIKTLLVIVQEGFSLGGS